MPQGNRRKAAGRSQWPALGLGLRLYLCSKFDRGRQIRPRQATEPQLSPWSFFYIVAGFLCI
jgi:hypothetical protein